jgi:hypothetical protein
VTATARGEINERVAREGGGGKIGRKEQRSHYLVRKQNVNKRRRRTENDLFHDFKRVSRRQGAFCQQATWLDSAVQRMKARVKLGSGMPDFTLTQIKQDLNGRAIVRNPSPTLELIRMTSDGNGIGTLLGTVGGTRQRSTPMGLWGERVNVVHLSSPDANQARAAEATDETALLLSSLWSHSQRSEQSGPDDFPPRRPRSPTERKP